MPNLILVALFFVGLLAAAFSLVRIGVDIRRQAREDRAFTDGLVANGAVHDDVRLYVLLVVQARDLDRSWEQVTDRADELWNAFTAAQREAAVLQLEKLDVPLLNVAGGAR